MRRALLALPLALALGAGAARAADDDTWTSIRGDIFGDTAIEAASPLVKLTTPVRAEDAAMVPVEVTVRLPVEDARSVRKVTLVVDENPAPVAAAFTFGGDRRDVALSTRLRVNAYSFVRAVAELSDGRLVMAANFVKASGGCSAPALKDPDAALANIGQMKIKAMPAMEDAAVAATGDAAVAASPAPETSAQVMIRHPNYSGLQMDQLTRLYIPAKFVNAIEVRQGDDVVFTMEGGISLSEDPAIRFSYVANGKPLEVKASDTDGREFSGVLGGT